MSAWELLDEKDEAELHKGRLLNVEEKPFKRITKRLATVSSMIQSRAVQQPTPPRDATAADAEAEQATSKEQAALKAQRDSEQLKEDQEIQCVSCGCRGCASND